ncbi:hypothetical protein [Kouleothrix sp.]|uniref:hypothetical protein n=1 Tax=Kouleothrix sp. TaxID=2779161 RepID=UPI003918CB09
MTDDLPRPEPPAFDKEAARRRYRATMRGPFMRRMNIALVLIILVAWGFGVAAALARDVEALPGHDVTVQPSRCVACHAAGTNNAPPMPHLAFPSCGFCHRQGPPPK